MNAGQSGSSAPRMIGGLVILLVAGTILYYIYDYWYNIGGLQQKSVIIANPIKATDQTSFPGDNDSSINLRDFMYTGGELSTSFWVYVTGMTNYTDKKHLISLEDSKNQPTLLVALGAQTNKLYVRVATDSNSFDKGTFMKTGEDGCNVTNFEAGRWVNVVVVLNNTVSDVYIDGKLARSCKLANQWKVNGTNSDKLQFKILQKGYGSTSSSTGPTTDFTGSFSNFVYYNYALSPDQVYRIYMAGPSGASVNLFEGIKRFFGGSKATTPALA